MKELKLEIKQGAVIINSGILAIDHEDIKLIKIDTKSKYATCDCWGDGGKNGYPYIYVDATERTLNIDQKNRDKDTRVELLDFKGWTVELASGGRYTITLVLTKIK